MNRDWVAPAGTPVVPWIIVDNFKRSVTSGTSSLNGEVEGASDVEILLRIIFHHIIATDFEKPICNSLIHVPLEASRWVTADAEAEVAILVQLYSVLLDGKNTLHIEDV